MDEQTVVNLALGFLDSSGAGFRLEKEEKERNWFPSLWLFR